MARLLLPGRLEQTSGQDTGYMRHRAAVLPDIFSLLCMFQEGYIHSVFTYLIF